METEKTGRRIVSKADYAMVKAKRARKIVQSAVSILTGFSCVGGAVASVFGLPATLSGLDSIQGVVLDLLVASLLGTSARLFLKWGFAAKKQIENEYVDMEIEKMNRRIVSKFQYVIELIHKAGVSSFGLMLFFICAVGISTTLLLLFPFLRESEIRKSLSDLVVFLFSGVLLGGSLYLGYLGKRTIQEANQMHTNIPLTNANSTDLPAPDYMVRASEKPEQEQDTFLLRAAREVLETPAVQLLRPANEL